MDDAHVVEISERLGKLAAPLNGLSDREGRAFGGDLAFKAAAAGVFEHNIGLVVAFADVEPALDVGVDEALGQYGFSTPTGRQLRAIEHASVRELDDHLVSGSGVFGPVDFGLGAVGQVLEQLIVVDPGASRARHGAVTPRRRRSRRTRLR
jgi:hypothetical protein